MLVLYRLGLAIAAPVLALWLGLRVLRGRERPADLGERLGGGPGAPGPAIWLHGASNGELAAARRLAEALLDRHPEAGLLVTANSVTARDMVRRWGLPRTVARLAPLDLRPCLARLIARHDLRLLLILENELWPNRLTAARARGVPVVLLGARVSARSAARWARLGGLPGPMRRAIALAAPQDAASGARLRALGLDAGRLGPPLQLKTTAAAQEPADRAGAPPWPRETVVLAASTHPGEEAPVIAAFRAARRRRPALRLILAPRHPARGPEIAEALAAAGLGHARRSAGERPGAETDVLLADTLGEMGLWYAAAALCFTGGSLVDKGGHTPWEPARAGCALLHGPHVANFTEAYAALDAAGGARQVADADDLAAALAGLDGAACREMTTRAADILDAAERASGLPDILDALDRLLARGGGA